MIPSERKIILEFFAEDHGLFAQYLGVQAAGRERRAQSLTPAGEASLRDILTCRRMELYWPLLWERMLPWVEKDYPLAAFSPAALPKQARQDALCRALEEVADLGPALFERYPLLERYDRLICSGAERALDEVFTTLEERRGAISDAFFGGRDFGKVTLARLPSSTNPGTRPGARMTLLLETEGGRFYFKPRVCTAENLYSSLMERFFPEVGGSCKVVLADRASFHESVEALPLASMTEAEAYYSRMGALSAVFYALQSGDMHSGNIVARGPYPVPIDLECLLPSWPAQVPFAAPLMEEMTLVRPRSGGYNSPLYVEPQNRRGRGNLPRLAGRPVTVLDQPEVFLASFSDAYRRILASAGEWVRMIRDRPDVAVRVLLRPHRASGVILRGMLKPAQLRSVQARDAWLERAWAALPEPQRSQFRELERVDFLSLDIPDFYLRVGESSVRREDGTVAAENAMLPPAVYAEKRFSCLSQGELESALKGLQAYLAAIRGCEEK